MAWLNSKSGGAVQYSEVSSTASSNGRTPITSLIESELEEFAVKVCQYEHPQECECWETIVKHLTHARHIYWSVNNAKKLSKKSEETGDVDNQIWLYTSSIARSLDDMCSYIDDILKEYMGGLYHKGHIEMFY